MRRSKPRVLVGSIADLVGTQEQVRDRRNCIGEQLLDRMRERLTHRRRDGAGLWRSTDGCVGLAHRRLAIIDLSLAVGREVGRVNRLLSA